LDRRDRLGSLRARRRRYRNSGVSSDSARPNTNEITVYLKLSDRLEALGAPGAFTAIDPFLDRLATDATLRLRLAQPGFVEEFVIIAAVLRVLGQSAT